MEIWKDIQGYVGLYQVSNLGRVRSYARGGCKIIKPLNATKGYKQVLLRTNGIKKRYRIHRLVAEAFLDNPEMKPVVNHINGVKSDNRLENLEWATHSENICHAFRTGLKVAKSGVNHYKSRQIVCIETGELFETMTKAVAYLRGIGFELADKGALTECARGRRHTAYGYTWKYNAA